MFYTDSLFFNAILEKIEKSESQSFITEDTDENNDVQDEGNSEVENEGNSELENGDINSDFIQLSDVREIVSEHST